MRKKKIKILHVAQAAGGVDRYIRMLLKYLDKEKFENILVCSQDFNREDYDGLVDSFEQIEMNRAIGVSDLNSIKEVRRLIKKYNPDIVYAHSSKAGAIARVADIGLKNHCVYNPHGWAFNMRCSDKKRAMYTAIEKMAAPFCEKIICISDAEKQSALEKKICREDKLQVIFNGVDIEAYESGEHGTVKRSSLGIPEDAYVVGMVGRISPQKAPDVFVKMAKLVKDEIPNAHFVIVGSGNQEAEIRKYAEENKFADSLHITGWVDDPMSYVELFDVACLLSRWEGFGLVKSNSVMGFAKFISLALDDWPESDVFQKIAITPPDEELNDSEYYLGLMSRISAIKDIAAVEDVLLEREPIFQRYELELWRRIAIVLTDRGDIRRLYNSGLKYIRFLKEISEKVTIRDEAVDAIEAYCVGLHNAEAVDEYGAFLKKCGELTQLLADNKRIAVICCQNYGRLMHLRLYKNVNAEIQEEWNAIVEILKQCNYDEDVYKNVLDAVEEYFRTLVQRKKEDKLFELERFMAQVYEENGRCEAAEVAALCLANLYNSGGHRKITPDEYETIKKYLQKFPESMHIRAAFIIASEAIYSPSAEYKRVPDKIINKAKQWSEQYPKKIEFQEAYFGLLFSRLKYAQAQDMRNEQRRVYREMKTVAERANYSEYNESNQLMESVDILHRVFGY